MTTRKGLILAGGAGTRLHPATRSILGNADARLDGATDFAYHVHGPERYGVAKFDQ